LKLKLIAQGDAGIIRVTDSVAEAAEIIKRECKTCDQAVLTNGDNGGK
jgi:hypothetical protein